jgi:DNA-binding NtrC family response regulator
MSSAPTGPVQHLLIVEDDPSFATRLRRNLEASGFNITLAPDVPTALDRLSERTFDLVMTDIRLPGQTGLDLLGEIQSGSAREAAETDPPPVVVLTSISSIDTAVEAMRLGAADYLTKEATREEIVLRLRNVLGRSALVGENRRLRRSLEKYEEFDEIVGASSWWLSLKEQLRAVASNDVTVLITGETGVGKELVARALHGASLRAQGPFIQVNAAALPDENMFLSELFGHEKGAFTGAIARKRGYFEQAEGGTLLLDEIGELGPGAQARLLRAVETLEFNRLGSEKPIHVNCRLLFATNKDLATEVKEGRFRQDLFYRINVYPLEVPPLRSRPEDIAPLARFFAARFAEKHHLAAADFSDDALSLLRQNPWPGNVRELRNVVERLAIRCAGKTIETITLRELNFGGGDLLAAGAIILPEGGVDLEEVEHSLVVQALQRADWNQRIAADLLKISVDRMNARVKKFNLSHPSWRVHKA